MRNVHERRFPGADPIEVGRLLDSLGQPDDRLWPNTSGRWAPMRLDGPLVEQPAGGHGLVRYRVVEHRPGRSVTFRFDPGFGLDGVHRMEVLDPEPTGAGAGPGLRHTIDGRTSGLMRLLWPAVVRPLHDAALEELLDTAEIELGLRSEPAQRPGLLVRFLLRVGPSPAEEERRVAAGS